MSIKWIAMPKTVRKGRAPFDGNAIIVWDKKFTAIVVRWIGFNEGFCDHHRAMVAYPEMYAELEPPPPPDLSEPLSPSEEISLALTG